MSNIEQATLKHYLEQWDSYFANVEKPEEFLKNLQNIALNGKLRSCNFRGVCWRIFLKCLPSDPKQWNEAIETSRAEYESIKGQHIKNPRLESKQKDLQMDNPLSQSDESVWQRYFNNNELIEMIQRDVRRTFPEMEYFHNEKVREMMVDILFCYAREHEDLLYRQGMHELLAPIVFILHCDLQAACHAREIGELQHNMNVILNEGYLEHDSYSMFCQLMNATNSWYLMTEKKNSETKIEESEKVLFKSQAQTSTYQTLAITNKLNHIHNTLLSQHDIELYTYLNKLEIIPQVYGLRWIRLLFGREFCLQDLLVLWDAIFADNCSLDLVDYIFVAMLIHIRHKLIEEEYSNCMQLLMKFPQIEDINDLVTTAKSIRNCKVGSIKQTMKLQQSRTEQAKTIYQQQNKISKFFLGISKQVNEITLTTKKNVAKSPPSTNSLTNPTVAHSDQSPISKITSTKQNERMKNVEMNNSKNISLEKHILILQKEVENYRQMCAYCADKIDSSVRVLQPELKNQENQNAEHKSEGDLMSTHNKLREQNLVAVASLKQVRDILRGSVNFSLNVKSDKRGVGKKSPIKNTAGSHEALPRINNGVTTPDQAD